MLGEPTTDRRTARHQATRAEILEAAWDIVRAEGLAALNLRDIARRVGMQPPSLYVYFDSKHAIYDAMFAQGAAESVRRFADMTVSGDIRTDLRELARGFVQFCADDPARFQLLFTRTIPGFEPSPESFAPAVRALELSRQRLAANGLTDQRHLDMWTALTTGLVDQQISNDPGGDRWSSLIEEFVDMFLTHATTPKGKRRARKD